MVQADRLEVLQDTEGQRETGSAMTRALELQAARYSDPAVSCHFLRFWDGERWTGQTTAVTLRWTVPGLGLGRFVSDWPGFAMIVGANALLVALRIMLAPAGPVTPPSPTRSAHT